MPEREPSAVIDGHPVEESWIANKVTVGRYGADFNVIQDAIDYCDAIGGEWTILVYPRGEAGAAVWNERDIEPDGGASITIKGMGEGRVRIAPTLAPVTAVIVSAHTLNLEDIEVIAPTNASPALRVTAGAFIATDCNFEGNGTGDSIQQHGGRIDIYHSDISVGEIDLSTGDCNLNIYHSNIYGGIDTDATALAHTISCEYCDFNGSSITIDSTGVGSIVTCTLRYCSDIAVLTDASQIGTFTIEHCVITSATKNGTSPWTCRITDFGVLSNANATGAITCYMGENYAIASAVGPIVWWQDTNTLKVIPSGTITNTIIGWAVAAASAGDTIVIHPGTYEEAVTLAAGINLVGIDKEACIINTDHATLITMAEGCYVANLTLDVTADATADGVGVECNNVGCTIENLIIKLTRTDRAAYGITENTGTTAKTIYIRNCRITSNDSLTYGVAISKNGKTVYVEECFVDCDTALYNRGTGTIYSSHNHLDGADDAIYMGAAGIIRCSNDTLIGPVAADAGIIRLRVCSYRIITRTGTGNIVDESPYLSDAPWHVEKWSWQAALANSQVAVRGTPIDAGSGQVQLEVTDNVAGQEAVEALAEAAGALGTEFTPARTPRCLMQIAHDAFDAHTTAFYGLRHTLGDDIPNVAAEECAGFDWNGTKFRAISSDGATGEVTELTTPWVDTQHQLEVIVFGGIRVEFYVDEVLVATHDTTPDGIPDATLDWQHLLETAGSDGGDVVQVTVRNGGCQECPA